MLNVYQFVSEEGLPLETEGDDDDDGQLFMRMKIPKQLPPSEADQIAMQTLDSAA